MMLGTRTRRAMSALTAIALASGTWLMTAGSAAAAVGCPVVDQVTHAVTPAPGYGVDWSGCDLSGANLSSADLSHANLSNAVLTGADLDWADLTGADISGANLSGAAANYAALTGADINQANLSSVTWTAVTTGQLSGLPLSMTANYTVLDGFVVGAGVIMDGADLAGMNLAGMNLSGSSLQNADLSGANLSNVNLYQSDLAGANLTSANLTSADLSGTDLTSTDLTSANLYGVSSGHITGTPKALPQNWALVTPYSSGYLLGPGANLSGANLSHAFRANADLAGANLNGASLLGGIFQDANLTGANMQQANLTQANMTGSDLTGADLTGADLTAANLADTTLTGANLASTTLSQVATGGISANAPPQNLPANWALVEPSGYLVGPTASLAGANLEHANLAGLDLYRDYIVNADLRYANLDGANMSGITLGGNLWLDTICPDGTNSNLYVDGCFSALDTDAPIAYPAVRSGTKGRNGWYTSAVTVSWNWSDLGQLDSTHCPGTTTTTRQGKPLTITATCADLAGNLGSSSFRVRVDTAPPAVAVTGVRAGRKYVIGSVPAASCRTTDQISGVAVPATLTVTRGRNGVGRFTATCSGAVDNAGNAQVTPVSVSYTVVYGFSGYITPRPGSVLAKSARKFTVEFHLSNAAGRPISAGRAFGLGAHHSVRVTLSGPGIAATAGCGWDAGLRVFRCVLGIPHDARTGRTVRYLVTVTENPGNGFTVAPAVRRALNPEVVHFRR